MNPNNEIEVTDAEVVNATVELGEGVMPVSADVQELAQLDPVAALISNIPHKSRAIAENYLDHLKEPHVRHERSEAEAKRGLPGRAIRRDYRSHRKFLQGKFWPVNGVKEVARRLRNAGKSAE